MAIAHRIVGQLCHERERDLHVLDRVLAALEGRPVFEILVHGLDVLGEHLARLPVELNINIGPLGLSPISEGVDDHADHVKQLLEHDRLLQTLCALPILDFDQLEKLLQLI